MLSIGSMGAGQERYYSQLAREDYYLEGGEPPGRWWGRGAAAIGVAETVTPGDLTKLFQGRSPTDGRLLVQSQTGRGKGRQAGWDLTFSAPKSVSVAWGIGGAEVRKAVQAAHAAAVDAALTYLENEHALTRRGKGGLVREPAGLFVARFEHGTSRELDPQLHTHCLVLNVGIRADGTTGTILSKPFYQAKMTAGAIYRNELAAELIRRLGVELVPEKTGFRIKDVSESLVRMFSKRRVAIEAALDGSGRETATAAAFAALQTRPVKDLVPSREELFATWTAEAGPLRIAKNGRERRADVHSIISGAVEDLLKNESHFSERSLLIRGLDLAAPHGVQATAVRKGVVEYLANDYSIRKLGELAGETRYTTKAMLDMERDLFEVADKAAFEGRHYVRRGTVENVIKKPRHASGRAAKGVSFKLSAEQAAAVRHVTNRAGGSIRVVSGLAGTGKTTMLAAAREAWTKAGYRVIGAAVAGKAARGLQEGSNIESTTLRSLLFQLQPPTATRRLAHHAKQIARAAKKKRTWKLRGPVDSKTVVVIDEAGMVGTRQMTELAKKIMKAGGLLVLVGDDKQLQAVEAGAPFASLAKRLGDVKLTEITRQHDERDRELVRTILAGKGAEAVKDLQERGLLHIGKTRAETIDRLVSDWMKNVGRRPDNALIFTGTREEAQRVNELCQAARITNEFVSPEDYVRVSDVIIHRGDRVRFTKRAKTLGIENGDIGTVVGFNRIFRTMTVRVGDRRTVVVPLRTYEHVTLGYAVTTHAGQGVTVGEAYVLANSKMQNRELTYVQASRSRTTTHVYTDRLQAGEYDRGLKTSFSQSAAKTMAHDVRPSPPQPTR